MSLTDFESLLIRAREELSRGSHVKVADILLKARKLTTSDFDRITVEIETGFLNLYRGEVNEALSVFEKQEHLSRSTIPKFEYGMGRSLFGKGRVFYSKGMYNKAFDCYKSSSILFEENGYIQDYLTAETQLGAVHFRKGNYDIALELLTRVLNKQQQVEVHHNLAVTTNFLGLVYYRRGNYLIAQDYFRKSEAYNTSLEYERGIAISLNNQAEIHRKVGELGKALQLYHRALLINEKKQNYKGMGVSNNNIGIVHRDRGEYDLAVKHFAISIDILEKSPNDKSLALRLSNLARLEHYRGHLEASKLFFDRSLNIYEESGEEEELVEKLCDYIELLIDMGDLYEGKQKLEECNSIAIKHDSEIEKLRVLVTKALVEKHKKNIGSAKKMFLKASTIAKKRNYYEMRIRINIFLTEIYLSQFISTNDEDMFDFSMDCITEASKLSLKQLMYPHYVKTLLIQSSLHAARMEYDRAKELLEKALAIAMEKDLPDTIKQAHNLLQQMDTRLKMTELMFPDLEKGLANMALKEAMAYMKITAAGAYSDVNIDEIYLVIFKHDSKGPSVLCTDELPFKKKSSLFDRIGFFYSLAVGQGHRHHEGLFGPLPLAGENDYSSLIFSIALPDSSQMDKRMKGLNYCLFCLIYPISNQNSFYDRLTIETSFRESLKGIKDINIDITSDFISVIKDNIITAVSNRETLQVKHEVRGI